MLRKTALEPRILHPKPQRTEHLHNGLNCRVQHTKGMQIRRRPHWFLDVRACVWTNRTSSPRALRSHYWQFSTVGDGRRVKLPTRCTAQPWEIAATAFPDLLGPRHLHILSSILLRLFPMHCAWSCVGLLALTSPVEAKIGDNLRIRKLRIRYCAELLGHLTPKRAAFSGADTSRMNLRGHGTTGKLIFFNVNSILIEICK